MDHSNVTRHKWRSGNSFLQCKTNILSIWMDSYIWRLHRWLNEKSNELAVVVSHKWNQVCYPSSTCSSIWHVIPIMCHMDSRLEIGSLIVYHVIVKGNNNLSSSPVILYPTIHSSLWRHVHGDACAGNNNDAAKRYSMCERAHG